jgi:hypothetical protein
LSGSEFHKTGAAYLNELLPYLDDFNCGICNRFVYRKLYLWSCFLTKLDNTGGARPFKLNLKILFLFGMVNPVHA